MPQQIIDYVAKYYSEKLSRHGAVPEGVDWNGAGSQELRFAQLLRTCSPEEKFSILDYGCGYGALCEYMIKSGFKFSYVGYDCADAMIEIARQTHTSSPECTFLGGTSCDTVSDYVVGSGIFNVRGEYDDNTWLEYCLESIKRMDKLATKGMSFNMLTSYSDAEKMKSYLYYADPCFFFDFCKRNIGRNVALLHDYDLYEFTILVRK